MDISYISSLIVPQKTLEAISSINLICLIYDQNGNHDAMEALISLIQNLLRNNQVGIKSQHLIPELYTLMTNGNINARVKCILWEIIEFCTSSNLHSSTWKTQMLSVITNIIPDLIERREITIAFRCLKNCSSLVGIADQELILKFIETNLERNDIRDSIYISFDILFQPQVNIYAPSRIRNALLLMLKSDSWYLKDLALSFLKCHGIKLELQDNHLDQIVDLICDEQIYVRRTAFNCLEALSPYTDWISAKQLVLKIKTQIEKEIDTLVLISIIDFLTSVMENSSHFVGGDFFTELAKNEDYEVRLHAVKFAGRFLATIQSDMDSPIPSNLLLGMIDDPSRLVRKEILDIIIAQRNCSQNRSNASRDEFMAKCRSIDTSHLQLRCQPEHLYQEILDVDQSILIENNEKGEGNNVLFCYDC